jgi:tRNA pseudouridine13 synthase
LVSFFARTSFHPPTMKVKQTPDDFRVEEVTDVEGTKTGTFSLYRLEKCGWTTPDALQVICRRWRVHPRNISTGGLKDRHAHTIQYLTICHGPERGLNHQRLNLYYLGKRSVPFTSRDIRANRFQLTLRALGDADIAHAEDALREVGRDGVPNYFDDQRFGSVGGGQFIAKALVLGDFERALRLALTGHYEHDRAAQKQEKAILNTHWGDWSVCRLKLPPGHARNLVEFLVRHPNDFRGAVGQLRPELRGLYLSAYQSHLWNRMLGRWLREHLRLEQLFPVPLRLGELPMHRRLDEEQRATLSRLELPLPTARGIADEDDPRTTLMSAVLAEEELTRDQLKVKGLREVFFSRGDRPALCTLSELEFAAAADELNRGNHKLELRFTLSPGCYATLVVKRISKR